jgi:hypothetical protein
MTFWTAQQCLKIVSVQSALRTGRYFRAKSWAAVLEILRQADKRLARIVAAHQSSESAISRQ